jgi:pyrroline-5-carboxylate reductase
MILTFTILFGLIALVDRRGPDAQRLAAGVCSPAGVV